MATGRKRNLTLIPEREEPFPLKYFNTETEKVKRWVDTLKGRKTPEDLSNENNENEDTRRSTRMG